MKRTFTTVLFILIALSSFSQLTIKNPSSCSNCDGKITIVDIQKVFTNGGSVCPLYGLGVGGAQYNMKIDGTQIPGYFTGYPNPATESCTINSLCAGNHTLTFVPQPGNFSGCSVTYSLLVTLSAASAGPDIKICSNQDVAKLQGNACGSTNFTWSPAAGLSDPNSLTPNVSAPGSYTLTVSSGNTTASDVTNVTFDPVSLFSYTITGNSLSLHMDDNDCTNIGFVWDYGNGTLNSTATNPTTTFANSGMYSVCLKCLGNPNNCISCVTLSFPGNTSGTVPLGISTNSWDATGFSIYPNPIHDKAIINHPQPGKGTVLVITNAVGEVVRTLTLEQSEVVLEKAELSNGLYFYTLLKNGKSLKTGKLILND